MRAIVTVKLVNASSKPTRWTARPSARAPLALYSFRTCSSSSGNFTELGPQYPSRQKFTGSEVRNEDQRGIEDLQRDTNRTGYGSPISPQVRESQRGQVKHEGMEPRDFPKDKVNNPAQTLREGTKDSADRFDPRDTDKTLPEKAGEQVANAAESLKSMVKEGWQMATQAAGFGAAETRSPTSKPGQDQKLGDMAGVDRAAMRLKDDVKDARDQIAAKAEDTKESWTGDKPLTERAKEAVRSAASSAADATENMKPVEKAKEMAAGAKNAVKSGMDSGLKAAGLREENPIEKVSRKVEEGASRAQERVRSSDRQSADSGYGEKLKESAKDVGQKAKDTAQKYGEKAKDAVESFNEGKVAETARKGGEKLQDNAKELGDRAEQAAEKLGNMSKKEGKKLEERAEDYGDRTKQAAKKAGEKLEDSARRS